MLIGGPELRRVARWRLRAGVFADEAHLAGAPLVDYILWATLGNVALVAKWQAALTDMLAVAAGTTHVRATVFLLAAPCPLPAHLHALLANARHAVKVSATHGVPATMLSRLQSGPAHAVMLVTELSALTHSVTVT